MRMVWGAAAAFGMLGFAASAWAGEDAVKLKDGPGKDLVQSACVGCHSLDYPITNSPFLDQKGWEAEVNKMIKAYGCPVNAEDVPKIIAYLAANYGKK
ncbi:MAG TPA: cytochrome c [Alphaproteobacteria bacterium]|nr:cytochrome c [Alphaproteobacteria bacterium]